LQLLGGLPVHWLDGTGVGHGRAIAGDIVGSLSRCAENLGVQDEDE
jgi:hypothetical protein